MTCKRVQRIGQQSDPRIAPAYTLVQELEFFYIAEYCGSWRLLDKSEYEIARQEE